MGSVYTTKYRCSIMTTITTREERGQTIAKLSGQVKRIDNATYTVKSQSNKGEYTIRKVGNEWV